MRRPGTILLLAIVIGAFGAALVYRYLRTQQVALEEARSVTGGALVDVIVASDTIAIGSQIEPHQVKAVRWPEGEEPEGAIRETAAVVGKIARTTIVRNEPVLQSELISEGVGLLPLLITEGMRAMSVKVDNVTGVSGFITPNSRVDVLVAGSPDATGGRAERSKVILQNITVLATGMSIEQRDNKPVEVPTVTLLVSPEDAEKLTLATRQEPVRLALRNYRDEGIVETPGTSTRALFGEERKPAAAAPAPAPARVARPVERPRRAPRHTVEVLLGDKVTRQDFF